MYKKMLTMIPGLQLTYKELEELDKNYFSLMPEYKKFVEENKDTLHRTRMLTSIFGRIRIFLGGQDEIDRQGINFLIQSPASDIMAYGLIALQKELDDARKKWSNFKARAVLSVHDSVVLLLPENERLVVAKMLKRSMCSPYTIHGKEVVFDGEVVIGPSYQLDDSKALRIDDQIKALEELKNAKSR